MRLTPQRRPVADELVALLEQSLRMRMPVRLRAWDGSEAGAPAAPGVPTVEVVRKRALRHVLWSPNELGIARAYVLGDLDVDGDLGDALRTMWRTVRQTRSADPEAGRPHVGPREVLRAIGMALRTAALGPRPRRPASESRLSGARHTRQRDRAAISHHYDLSNEFYGTILDSTMSYSSGYWQREGAESTLEAAQVDKLDLICRKLGLAPGMRLLDIGCGWGSLALHAAEHYDVDVTGVTLSAEQRDFVRARAGELGLDGRLDIRLQHFRDIPEDAYDAVASVEMGEHVGEAEYVEFAHLIMSRLRPQGRAVVQLMSRHLDAAPGGGAFIETYIAPDMHMRPVAQTVGLLADAGLEIREVHAMREHYPLTVAAWAERLEQSWDRVCDLVGVETARVWRLYLAGGSLAFEENRMGVDQILVVRPGPDGVSAMPRTARSWVAP